MYAIANAECVVELCPRYSVCGWVMVSKGSLHLVALTLVLLLPGVATRQAFTAYEKLLTELFENYDPDVFPARNAKDIPVTVHIDLAIDRVIDMDEIAQSLRLNVWIRWSWYDKRLQWDESQHNITNIVTGKIWMPDIILYDDIRTDERPLEQFMPHIFSDGLVRWNALVTYVIVCKVNPLYFPFDLQHCEMTFGSWGYTSRSLMLVNMSRSGDVTQYTSNGEWELVEIPINIQHTYYGEDYYTSITFTPALQRRGAFYMINLICPAMFMAILATFSFYLPSESNEKASLAVTMFLSQMVFDIIIVQYLPSQSEVTPIIVYYVSVTQGMMSLSTLFSVFVIHVHYRGMHGWRMPKWQKQIFFAFGRMLGFNTTLETFEDKIMKAAARRQTFLANIAQGHHELRRLSQTIPTIDESADVAMRTPLYIQLQRNIVLSLK
ncbi:Neuronal acetylcholine receptor subunit alpha-6, partial [Lamellibrachia satsuma]